MSGVSTETKLSLEVGNTYGGAFIEKVDGKYYIGVDGYGGDSIEISELLHNAIAFEFLNRESQ